MLEKQFYCYLNLVVAVDFNKLKLIHCAALDRNQFNYFKVFDAFAFAIKINLSFSIIVDKLFKEIGMICEKILKYFEINALPNVNN